MLLIEKSKAYIAAHVAISEIGTASAGMMVAVAERRNRKITRMTRQKAIASVSCTSATALRIEIERSSSVSMLIEAGTCARNCGKRAFTESTTSTVLASGCR